jgi:peptidoglycan/xylan/chitin deacetylase (PgdA/CDA1 family)
VNSMTPVTSDKPARDWQRWVQAPLKQVARTAFHRVGAVGMARWIHRKGLRILMYHRFSDREALARQCAHIRAHYMPISMARVADWLSHGAPLPQNALAVTVDDGYRDFYQVAYPLFREYGIPATVYLVSDFLDRELWLWVDQVRYAFLHGKVPHAELATTQARKQAAYEMTESAKRMPNGERLRLLAELPARLQVALPREAPPQYEPLRWDEVREMVAAGFEFGAHTRTHPVLSRLAGAEELADEIAGSKRQIERQVGCPVDHFCYPNGSKEDFGPDAVEAVRMAGFRTAVTTETGLNYPGADPFQLVRIGVEPGLDPDYFARCSAGFRV